MSESFSAAIGKVNYGRYIDEIEEELAKSTTLAGPGRTPQQVEAIQQGLCDLIRRQAKELAKEVGFSGSHVLVFMTATAIISTAWISFALRRETSDLSKSPEDRLSLVEMLDSLEIAFEKVISSAESYADMKK